MANSFVNSKQVKLFLAKLIDAAPYIKASKAHFAGQFKGKKAGKNGSNYVLYLNDAGNPTDGINITESDDASVKELPVTITMKHKKTLVNLDVLESVVDIEDFKNEVAEPYGVRLGAEVQKDVIENTYFGASTAFVGTNGWDAMSKASGHLRSIRQGAAVTGFIDPMCSGNLTVNALNNWHFGPSQKGQDFYGDASVGKFQNAEYVECTDLPMIEGAGVEEAEIASVSFDGSDNATITLTAAIGTALPKGYPLVLEGANACNSVGMKTNAPFVVFLQEAATAAATSIKVGRITTEDVGYRNCFIEGTYNPEDTDALLVGKKLGNILTSGKKYYALQHRINDVLDFETVPMDDLIGAETKSAKVGGLELKVTTLGKFDNLQNQTRWDFHYADAICDNRYVSMAFVEV